MSSPDRVLTLGFYAGITSFSLLLPSIEIASSNDAFLVLGGWRGMTTISAFALLFVLPTTVLFALDHLLTAMHPSAAHAFRAAVLGIGAALVWSQAFSLHVRPAITGVLGSSTARAALFALVAVLVVLLAARVARRAHAYLSILAILTLVLTASSAAGLPTAVPGRSTTPDAQERDGSGLVVLLVFDGLALSAIMEDESIDPAFPTFARISREWTWYRDATTNATFTLFAQPMLLTGRYVTSRAAIGSTGKSILSAAAEIVPVRAHLFSRAACFGAAIDRCGDSGLEGDLSLVRALFASWWEVTIPTQVRQLKPGLTDLASWRFGWAGPAPDEPDRRDETYVLRFMDEFSAFLDDVTGSHGSGLFVHWSFLSHFPYVITEDGRIDLGPDRAFLPEMSDEERSRATARYRDQLRYVDSRLRALIEGLERAGRYESSVIVVTSDHGVSSQGNNFLLDDETTRIPLFVKAPGLAPGPTDRNAQTVDIAPTIADHLGSTGTFDGQSLLRPHRSVPKVIFKLNEAGVWVRGENGSWHHEQAIPLATDRSN